MSLRSAPLPITIKHPEEVEALLRERPKLRPYMEEAARRLVETFGPDSAIEVDVTTYVEEPDEPILELLITTSLDASVALDRLHAFDREWFVHQPPIIQTQLLIDVVPA